MAANTVKEAIRSGDVDALDEERLEELGFSVNSVVGDDGFSLVHWACHYGRAEVLQHFLELGGDVNRRTKQGWTGGHICAIRGCTICLQVLCSSGLDLSAVDSRGYTCAHLAAAHGKCSALQAIFKAGEDVKKVDQRGWTVLHHAAYHGRLGIVQFVIKYEIDPNSEDKVGNTPAHLAAAEGHLECLKVLVYHRKQPLEVVTCKNNNGETPKDLAVQFQKQDCVDFLTSAEIEADIFEYTEGGEYPAHAAAHEGNVELLGMLIHEGHCGVNDRDHMGATPAHKAAGNGHTQCLQWLIDHGADISLKNNNGETARDVAIRFAHVGCAALLATGKGSDQDSFDLDRDTPDKPTPKVLARVKEKVDELQEQLGAAKTRFRQLGGELPEDKEIELIKEGHKQDMSEMEMRLEYERERREGLEAELDQLRKQLQHTTAELHHCQMLLRQQKSTTPTPDHGDHRVQRSKHRSHSRRRTPEFRGGAFVRIDHV